MGLWNFRNFLTGNVLRRSRYVRRFSSMTRFNDKVESDSAAIREVAEAVRLLATQLERHADFIDEHNLPKVVTTHWATARDAIDGLARFAGAVQQAAIRARMMIGLEKMAPEPKPGRDDEPDEPTKKRSAKKKSS